MFLYVTNDKIGAETGGGQVTKYEYNFLKELGPIEVINPDPTTDPFDSESDYPDKDYSHIKLAHFYGGTFPRLVKKLKSQNIKVTYTVAAHDVSVSKREFENLGLTFGFRHLTEPALFEHYISSYKYADVVICPSSIAQNTNNNYGINNTTVIHHGHEPVKNIKYPKSFTAGYLGQCGPDKGVRYLIEAWALLNYNDCALNIGGKDSATLLPIIRHFKHGNYNLMGWVKSVEEFYNSCSIYVQPSATEGFGIEVLEAMSAGRPVVVSRGAGASDVVDGCGFITDPCDARQIAEAIDELKSDNALINSFGSNAASKSRYYTWEAMKCKYHSLWKELIND